MITPEPSYSPGPKKNSMARRPQSRKKDGRTSKVNNADEKRQVERIERDVYVSLKDHFEAILKEQNRAIEQATAEREKAASILREGLLHQIKSGDEALGRHIAEQVTQLRAMIQAQREVVTQAHTSSERAITKAEEATEKRLDLLNEFRAQAADEQKRFLPVNVYNEKHIALQDKVSVVETSLSRLYGGLIVVGAIGIANLVKLWFIGH